jgi:hypothetical protein
MPTTVDSGRDALGARWRLWPLARLHLAMANGDLAMEEALLALELEPARQPSGAAGPWSRPCSICWSDWTVTGRWS